MPNPKPAAFLSYARNDDSLGYVTRFRKRLAIEIEMVLGEEFSIFQDREDILWGENWKARIGQSLMEVTFLIPIISPSFFNSPFCRDEVSVFLDHAENLGRDDLILPIYYIECQKPSDDDPEEVKKLYEVIFSRQYEDWRQLRSKSPRDRQVAPKITKLAEQVLGSIKRVREKNVHPQTVRARPQRLPPTERKVEAVAAIQYCRRAWEHFMGAATSEVEPATPTQRGTRGYLQRYANSSIYWCAPYGAQPVFHDVNSYYDEHGGTSGLLGFPATPEDVAAPSQYGGRGAFQRFEGLTDYSGEILALLGDVRYGSTVYWSEQFGAFSTFGAIGECYESYHGTGGWMGFPSSEEMDAETSPRGTIGRLQRFEGGTIYWTQKHGACAVGGIISVYYEAMGGTNSLLGFPATRETPAVPLPQGTTGVFQRFESTWDYAEDIRLLMDGIACGATVYWSEPYGAHATRGGIGVCYERSHGTAGRMGFPTSDELQARSPQGTSGRYQTFERGTICWCEEYNVYAVYGAINAEYLRLGGTGSSLGFPISEDRDAPNSQEEPPKRIQYFEGGAIYWTPNDGAYAVYSEDRAENK